ncbi:MAG: class I tRNA ligase family protein, partial [Cyclobacteriaceae bacterium]|nr:class I tRNA ligase family protein [Cyclobacteriaceae bacterium]
VARMIIAGYEYMDQKPFEDVYLTGIVRDKLGRKMSKSLGNSPDPLDLITNYGADGVRTGMLFSSPAGNDLLFDEKLCEQGRNFANKIWNAFRLVKGWDTVEATQPIENAIAIEWFESKLHQSITEIEDHFSKFRLSDALHSLYKLVWDDFCSWYLEIIKPEFGKPIDTVTHAATIGLFESVLKLLHPFMPFITEELWHELRERSEKDCIITAQWPVAKKYNQLLLEQATLSFAVVSEVRNIRSSKGLSPKEALTLISKTPGILSPAFIEVIKKLANLERIDTASTTIEQASGFMIGTHEFLVPLVGKVDVEKETAQIRSEIEYHKGFLASVDTKLSNEKFVKGAPPQVIELERKKKADAESKIKALEENLKNLLK